MDINSWATLLSKAVKATKRSKVLKEDAKELMDRSMTTINKAQDAIDKAKAVSQAAKDATKQ